MNQEQRQKHIDFIESDTKERGEEIVSDISFFAAIYQCKVKKEGDKKSKTVVYSAAQSVMAGYRKINVTT
jgi:hypothetical protein